MRARIVFLLKNRGAYIPFHHQFLLAQLIKGIVLKGGNPNFSSFKIFNFSGLKGQTKPSRKGLHYYSSRVTLVVSSLNKAFLDYLLLNLFQLPQVEVGGLILQPEKVEVENIDSVEKNDKFICISPLVLMEPKILDDTSKEFIQPEDDEFSDLVYEATLQRMEACSLFDSDKLTTFNEFQIVPDKAYLDKLNESHKKFSRVYPLYDQDVKYEVRGYTFPFSFYAEPEVKKFVFLNGLGALTHKGFGMIDVAHQDPNVRAEEYEIPGLEKRTIDSDSDTQ
ncbi:MAG: CRISPR-associated endoribonuclease Cas6 [Cyclobacteriaceae bacterium]|nr:CRISPR-associated endoribonuclease Cas6 [Cyclobacteriaceae bacterium]